MGNWIPFSGGVIVIDHAGPFWLEERVRPTLGDVHKLIDDFFVLVVEVFNVLLCVEVRGMVPQTVHLFYRVSLEYSSGTLLAYRLESL